MGMASKDFDNSEIRAYLLGTLKGDEALETIEERLVSDPEFAEFVYAEEDELIDDFVCGNLQSDEIIAFNTGFVITPARRARIETARLLCEYSNMSGTAAAAAEPATRGFFEAIAEWFGANRLLAVGSLAAIVIAIGMIAWFAARTPDDSGQILSSLNKAYETERPLDARITGLGYAPKIDRRGASPTGVDETARNRAELLALNARSANENAATLHALARVHLAKNDPESASKLLDKAVKLDPANSAAITDLGTAFLALADHIADKADGRRLEYYARALEHFDLALSKQPAITEARFNRALALEKMSQREQAIEAWRKYLEFDSASPWADEARKRLAVLESRSTAWLTGEKLLAQFLTAYRQNDEDRAFDLVSKNREMITGKLIPQQLAFLFANAAEQAARDEALSAMHFIAGVEMRRTSDPFWTHLAEFYSAYGNTRIADLNAAHASMRSGYSNALANNYEEAFNDFASARSVYGAAGDAPEAAIADYWVGYAHDRNGRFTEAKATLAAAAANARTRNYAWLASQYLCWLGQIEYARNESSISIDHATEALLFAERAKDDYNRQKLYDLLTINYRGQGAYDEAMRYAEAALELSAAPSTAPRQHWRTLNTVAELFTAMGLQAAAESLQSESLLLNRERINEGTFEHMALLRLGQMAALRGDDNSSFDYLQQSRSVLATFDPAERDRHSAYLDLINGHVLRDADRCAEALPLYDRAIAFYDRGEFTIDRYDAYKGRLICHLNLGNGVQIDRETPIVFGLLEKYREAIREESGRNAFFGREQEIYDALIDREFSLGRIEKAFEYAELSRARSLLDLIASGRNTRGKGASSPLSVPRSLIEIQRAMPPDAQLVQYAFLERRLIAWIITTDVVRVADLPVNAADLRSDLSDFNALLSMPGGSSSERRDALARKLGGILFGPIRPMLSGETTVVIVPDKALAGIPFGALRVDTTDEYLVREFEIQYAPSATIFTSENHDREMRPAAEEKLLAVGSPEFDRAAFDGLADLPAADREIGAIADGYAGAVRLTRELATKQAVIAELQRANIFHFAGHYIFDGRTPMRSGLLLAGEGGELLSNSEIVGMSLPGLDLVVLSACETGSETIIDGEGMLGAARTFLSTGVPQVIASHWEVDSDATADLMTNFHDLRKSNGLSSAHALRMAQLSMLEGPNTQYRDPFYWAPFIVYGG